MTIYITPQMLETASQIRTRPARRGILGELGSAIADRWQRRRTIAELESMDDALLRDIGISRGEIAHVAEGRIQRAGSRRAWETADQTRFDGSQGSASFIPV